MSINPSLKPTIAYIWFLSLCFYTANTSAQNIGALGIIQPEAGLISVMAKSGVRLESLHVTINETIEEGQLLAIYTSNESDLLAQHKADNSIEELLSEIELQTLIVDSHTDSMEQASSSLESYQSLAQEVQSKSALQIKTDNVVNAKNALAIEQRRLQNLKIAMVNRRSEKKLGNPFKIISPINGNVMSIQKYPGDSSAGVLLQLADLSSISIKTEVFESDLKKIKIGNTATVSSPALTDDLTGKVYSVGRLVDASSKTAEVWIRLNDAANASKVVGMEVNVSISK